MVREDLRRQVKKQKNRQEEQLENNMHTTLQFGSLSMCVRRALLFLTPR